MIIDDDRKLCGLIADYLTPLGYVSSMAHTGVEGLELALSGKWNAIILDVMLPEMDGFEVLKRIRAKSDVPVLMLTGRGEESDRIVGLEIGADDYLPKTFSTRELLARLRAVTRRNTRQEIATEANELRAGSLVLNLDARLAVRGEAPVSLTPVEFDLLAALMRSKGRVKTRESLLDEIRSRNYEVFDRSIDVHIAALRKKLGDDPQTPRFIRTVRGLGYLFLKD